MMMMGSTIALPPRGSLSPTPPRHQRHLHLQQLLRQPPVLTLQQVDLAVLALQRLDARLQLRDVDFQPALRDAAALQYAPEHGKADLTVVMEQLIHIILIIIIIMIVVAEKELIRMPDQRRNDRLLQLGVVARLAVEDFPDG